MADPSCKHCQASDAIKAAAVRICEEPDQGNAYVLACELLLEAEGRGRGLERASIWNYAEGAFPSSRVVAALVKDIRRGEHAKGLSDV